MKVINVVIGCCALAACGGQHRQAAGTQGAQQAQVAATPPDTGAPNAHPAGAAVSGQAVFGRTCTTCHQANGQGLPGAFPPLAKSPYATGSKDKLIRLVLNGLTGPVTVAGQHFNGVMPPWKGQLSDAEIAAVLSYVRNSFGNSADSVSASEVQQQRAATASRTSPWTMQELDRSH